MALVHADLVLETSTTTGTGTLTLAGAATGYRTFAAGVGSGNTCYYALEASNGQKETGLGTVGSGTLERTTLIASSTGAKLDLPAGTHNVGVTVASASLATSGSQAAVSQTAHGLTAIGTPVYSADGAAWDVAAASTAATIHLGVVSAIADADHFTLQQSGWITGIDFVTLTAGQFYYLTDAGSLSTTPGTINAPVLFATGSASGIILPFRAFDAAGSTDPAIVIQAQLLAATTFGAL